MAKGNAIHTARRVAYRIGRDPKSHVLLVHPSVSRTHAVITPEGGEFRLKDIGSTYGTFVKRGGDWRKIQSAKIGLDDPVMLGRFRTTARQMMELADAPESAKPTADASGHPDETRKLAVILVADMVAFSKTIRDDESGTISALSVCRREVIRPNLSRYRGRLFNVAGDGIFAEFESVVDAVRCGIDIQRAIAGRKFGSARKVLQFRIGIHLGEIVVRKEDYLGDAVNVAARLQEFSPPGGICVSDLIFHQLRGRSDIPCEDGGERRIKHVPEPLHVYLIRPSVAT